MKKEQIKCPDCDGILITINRVNLKRHCGQCSHEWLPHAINTWRVDTCIMGKCKDTGGIKFSIYFEDGFSVSTTIAEQASATETLHAITHMFATWQNGDNILEPIKEIEDDEPTDTNYNNELKPGLDLGLQIIAGIKKRIMDGNPTPGNFTITRDAALLGLENAENELLIAKMGTT